MSRHSLLPAAAALATSLGTLAFRTSASTPGCANPRPGWIWCDDFEQDRSASYFAYDSRNGSFTREAGVGRHGSTAMRARWKPAQEDAGSIKLAFGRTPGTRMPPVDGGPARYRDVYWRVFVRSQAGWE